MVGWSHEEKPDRCVKKYFKNLAVCAIIAKAICAKLGGVKMKHIKTLNTQTLNNTVKKGGKRAAVVSARLPASLHVRHPVQ